MTFDENTLRSVIEEVLKEMGEVSGTAAAPAAAPVAAAAGKLTITENGEARKGTARRRGGHRPGARLRHQAG